MLPSGASALRAQLKRYPYLTDVVGNSATVNWATDRSATSAVVKWGTAGAAPATPAPRPRRAPSSSSTASPSTSGRRQLTGLTPTPQYCYRVYLGTSPARPARHRPLPTLLLPDPGRLEPAVHVRRLRRLGRGRLERHEPRPGEPDARSPPAAPASPSRPATTPTTPAARPTTATWSSPAPNTSAVFGPNFWTVPGRVDAALPGARQPRLQQRASLSSTGRRTRRSPTSSGRYLSETYCCLNGTTSKRLPERLVRVRRGNARFYVLEAAWANTNVGTATSTRTTTTTTGRPALPSVEWLQNDLATHPRAAQVRVLPLPALLGQPRPRARTRSSRAPDSLEGLLSRYNVDIAFNGHAHIYQRNRNAAGRPPDLRHGRRRREARADRQGARLQPHRRLRASAGRTRNSVGSACGAAPVPTSKDRVFHFLQVSVNGTTVTVTPTNSLGQTFDPITYNAPAQDADLSLTKTDSPDPVPAGSSSPTRSRSTTTARRRHRRERHRHPSRPA